MLHVCTQLVNILKEAGPEAVVDMDRAGMLLGFDVIALAGFHKEIDTISVALGGASPWFDTIHEGKFCQF